MSARCRRCGRERYLDCYASGCRWTGYAGPPAEPKRAIPTCACGKPGSYRGDPDKGYQTMRCTDCCAKFAVQAAIERSKPPAFMVELRRRIEATGVEVKAIEDVVASCAAGLMLRIDIQRQLEQARSWLDRATRTIEENS